MFERFADAATVMHLAREGNLAKLEKLIRGGCKIDRRTTYDPCMTPLDAAAATGNAKCAGLLLTNGAPVRGSSIFHAIKADSQTVLEVFHNHNACFFRYFIWDEDHTQNYFLNRWLLHFTALDFALSIGASASSGFLEAIGASRATQSTRCWSGHYAPYIRDESFVSFGGVNVDEQSQVTEGYYCAKCGSFVKRV